jgi:hypothetical protein
MLVLNVDFQIILRFTERTQNILKIHLAAQKTLLGKI